MNQVDFKKMSKIERLQAMKALWDSMLYEDGEIETPEWHEKILKERKSLIEDGKAKFIPLAQLKVSRKK
jgi:hypothetical protein